MTRKSSKTLKSATDGASGVRLVRTLRGHSRWIGRIAWSPDGRLIASPSDDGTIRLWNAQTGECLRTLNWHGVNSIVAFHPNGETLAVGGQGQRQQIVIWETATGSLLRELTTARGFILSIAFDPTGDLLATGGQSGVDIWDAASGRPVNEIKINSSIHSLAFDPTGRFLTGGGGFNIQVWDRSKNWTHRNIATSSMVIFGIAFDPSGRILAGGSGKTIQVWDVQSGRLLHELEGHTNAIDWLAFSNVCPILASKSDDGTVRLWHSESWQQLISLRTQRGGVGGKWPGLAFHPHLPLLASVAVNRQKRYR